MILSTEVSSFHKCPTHVSVHKAPLANIPFQFFFHVPLLLTLTVMDMVVVVNLTRKNNKVLDYCN